ncbi:sugar phosphate isomerase/epimerase family protein [Marinicrinis sediminis]|uniref:Sugar phosphate isomerase/epimerase family protein n=1 Tax=Marinicrinis sediminis TaxID=1652465 RepID=A0ABW5R8U1_9BACL
MKIAAFSGLLMDYSMHEAMDITRRMGLDGIEIACREPHLSADTSLQRVKEIRRLADEHQLGISALAGYMGWFSTSSDDDCERAFDECKRMMERADILGTNLIRVFQGGPNAFLAAPYHYEKAAHWLRRCAEEADKLDKKIALEIHNQSLIEDVESALKLIQLVDHPRIGLIHDAGNMYVSDSDYGADSIYALQEHLFHVHVKDERRIDEVGGPSTFTNRTKHGEEAFRQCLLGDGEVNHQPIFHALQKIGYDGWITLECFSAEPPEERLRHDLQVVRKLLAATST